ncbi:MAG TPA: hypothetical protein VMF03_11170 [Steroidobacteraceae bacterium]|nr:hypothetical protein [Steroidobacteraceae bacterium]
MPAAVTAAGDTAAAAAAQRDPDQSKPFNPRDLTGIWMQERGRVFKSYPFTPQYAAIMKQRERDAANGNPYQVAGNSCLPAGLASSMTTGAYPIEIYYNYGGKEILFDKENVGALYRVYLYRKHLPADELVPMFYGDSVGHWEGNVLVVDTISLGAAPSLDLIAPSSDALHVIQRFQRVDYDTLHDEITFIDPKALTHSVTGLVVFKRHELTPQWEMQEYECTNERLNFGGGKQSIAPAQ